MTDEQLQRAMKEVSEDLDRLSKSEEPLTKQEARRKRVLAVRLQALEQIEEAKIKKNKSDELYNAMCYEILSSWGEKHPFWVRFIMTSLRWNPFI